MDNEKNMKFSIYRSIGTLGMIFLLLLAIRIGGEYRYLINLPAAIILFCFVFFVLLCTFEKDFLTFIPNSVLTLFFTPSAPSAKYAEISKYGSRYSIGGALIIMLISYIQMLVHMDDPGNMGLILALTLLPAFYALIFYEVFFVIVHKAYCPKDSDISVKNPSFQMRSLVLFIAVIGLICFTCIVFQMAFQTTS